MANPVNKKIRQMASKNLQDNLIIGNLMFNKASGAQKNLSTGPYLKAVPTSSTSWTTDATTPLSIPLGSILALYNKGATLASATLGPSSSVGSLASGVVDAGGNVGIPCPSGEWTYLSSFDKSWVCTSTTDLLVFLVEDDTYISDESPSK